MAETSKKKEESKADAAQSNFFRYYGQLVHQQNMLQDAVRTSTYRDAIMQNAVNFKGKVVLDVGTGSGILAFFAAQAGARRVYAVEASCVAKHARTLVEKNGFSDIIKVLEGKVEEVDIPEKVDVIISEPMGFLLVHERMLESYVAARDRFLKPGGLMFPSSGTIYMAPFTDSALYAEQMAKVQFWEQTNFHGIDLSSLREQAVKDHLAQPVVGYFSPKVMIASPPVTHRIDFQTVTLDELKTIDIEYRFEIERTALMHGLACWFDVTFNGTTAVKRLSTGPHTSGTHWYQCRLLMQKPLAVNATQVVTGKVNMVANDCQSYNITLDAKLDGSKIGAKAIIRLQDQMYHYLTSPQTYPEQYAQNPQTDAWDYGHGSHEGNGSESTGGAGGAWQQS